MAISFIGGRNWTTRRKSPTCRKSLKLFNECKKILIDHFIISFFLVVFTVGTHVYVYISIRLWHVTTMQCSYPTLNPTELELYFYLTRCSIYSQRDLVDGAKWCVIILHESVLVCTMSIGSNPVGERTNFCRLKTYL